MFQAFEKLVNLNRRAKKGLRWLYTMTVVLLALVMFRAGSVSDAGRYYMSLFGANGLADATALFYLRENWLYLLLGVIFCAPVDELARRRVRGRAGAALETARSSALLVLFVISVTYLVKGTYNPFIYFNF